MARTQPHYHTHEARLHRRLGRSGYGLYAAPGVGIVSQAALGESLDESAGVRCELIAALLILEAEHARQSQP